MADPHPSDSRARSKVDITFPPPISVVASSSLEHLLKDYLPLASRWIVWDSRVLPAKRLAISGENDIETVRRLIAP
jgi:hypothetical protein